MKQARGRYRKSLEYARGGDQGAITALVALLLGLRAIEIVSRVHNDHKVKRLVRLPSGIDDAPPSDSDARVAH